MSEGEERFSLSPVRVEYVSALSILLCSMEPWLTLGYTPEVFEFYLLQSDLALARNVVLISGEVAGVVSLRNPWLFGPLIELLALFEGFRGRGIGRSIVDWIGERYKANNLWVTVSSFNLGAQRFYEKAGFEKTAILEDLIKPGWEEILLRKQMRQQER
ncbi:MAG: GNAT family N-acetyltransferase [Syntrophobacteraceae bacterium]